MKFNRLSTPVAYSLALHVALALLLTLSFTASHPPQPQLSTPQPIIKAMVVDQKQVEQRLAKIQAEKDAQRRAEQQRIKELQRRAAEAERKRLQQKAQRLAQQKKAREAEKRRAAQAAADAKRKKQLDVEKARKAEQQRKKQEQQRKLAEEQARKAKEQRDKEAKERAEQARKRKEQAERAEQQRILQEQLEAEQAVRQQQRNKVVLTEVQKYQALIKQTIQRNLLVDPAYIGKSCRLNIRLASNGLVTQVKILAGDPILCEASRRAVYKPDTLPVSAEADVYQKLKDINLTVEPGS